MNFYSIIESISHLGKMPREGSPLWEAIDYNGVAFSIELLEWGRTFSDFWGKTVLHISS